MIGLKMDKPKNCLYCPVRMECVNYMSWLHDKSKLHLRDLNVFMKGCLIVDLDKYEDDLK